MNFSKIVYWFKIRRSGFPARFASQITWSELRAHAGKKKVLLANGQEVYPVYFLLSTSFIGMSEMIFKNRKIWCIPCSIGFVELSEVVVFTLNSNYLSPCSCHEKCFARKTVYEQDIFSFCWICRKILKSLISSLIQLFAAEIKLKFPKWPMFYLGAASDFGLGAFASAEELMEL